MLLWLFRQGTRISDTLRVKWGDLDLTRATVKVHVHKTDTWLELPLHAELVEEPAAIPPEQQSGFLFPWRDKSSVYYWLRRLARQLGVRFTPHMGRLLGTWLSQDNATLKTILAALGHADVKSSMRYQNGDHLEVVPAASARLPRLRRDAAAYVTAEKIQELLELERTRRKPVPGVA